MNRAANLGEAVSFERVAKAMDFELVRDAEPRIEPESEIRKSAPVLIMDLASQDLDATFELEALDANDLLLDEGVPDLPIIDTEEPSFELRVPDILLERAAQLKAQLPRQPRLRARELVAPEPRTGVGKLGRVWMIAAGLATCVGVLAACLSYDAAPKSVATPTYVKHPHVAKVLSHRASDLASAATNVAHNVDTGVEMTVSVDNLPRALKR